MDAQSKRLVRARAGGRCEYCHLDQAASPLASLQIEHVRPKKHHGGDELENLALACIDCNLHKGSNLAGIDPLSSQLTELFHPRQHVWEDHFEIAQGRIRGKTAIGRVTVDVMNFNSEEQVLLRLAKG
ncbi:MAG: HNH endonuclease [Pirellulaceae bacterium]